MNIKKLGTTLVIGSFILMSITGIMMFFHLKIGRISQAHEWFSWLFIIGGVIHIYSHFKSFKITIELLVV